MTLNFQGSLPALALAVLTFVGASRCLAAPEGPAPASAKAPGLKLLLHPAAQNGGFSMEGYILWCPSVVKVGDTYHMFASRWPAQYGIAGWTKYSHCVRASATNLLGPYTFREIVLEKRPDSWDNTRIHNVKIVRSGTKFVLYYIDTANETGFADADSIIGPWHRRDKPAMRVSNPAILIRPDLTVYVLGRLKYKDGANRAIGFTAPSYEGPYTLLRNGDNLLPDRCELEDPTIWWGNGQFNVLLNDWKGKATGISKAGAQYCSRDGLNYQLVSREPVFTKTVLFDDRTSETFSRRERPFIYADENHQPVALFTACLLSGGPSRIVAQTVGPER